MYKPTLLFLVFFLVFGNLHAQYKGTVYYTDTTSAQGYVSFEMNNWGFNSITFYPARQAEGKTYGASEIKGFEYTMSKDPNTTYQYRAVNLSKSTRANFVFMRVLYDGEFKILQMEKGLSSDYFVLGDNLELSKLEKKSHQFREQLDSVATDCDNTKSYLKSTSLKTKSLIRFGNLYRTCNENTVPVAGQKLFLTAGYLNNKFEIKKDSYISGSISSDVYSSGYVPAFGIGYETPLTSNGILALVMSANFYKAAYYKEFIDNEVNREITINQNSVQVPVMLKLSTKPRKFSFFVSAGPSVIYHYKNDLGIHTQHFDQINNQLSNTYDYPDVLKDLELAMRFSVAMNFKIYGHLEGGIGSYYSTSLMGDSEVYATKNGYSSIFGFNIRLYYNVL